MLQLKKEPCLAGFLFCMGVQRDVMVSPGGITLLRVPRS